MPKQIVIRGPLYPQPRPQAATPPARELPPKICRHRLEFVEELDAGHCGCDRRVFRCEVFGECISRLSQNTTLNRQIADRGLAICRGCDRFDPEESESEHLPGPS